MFVIWYSQAWRGRGSRYGTLAAITNSFLETEEKTLSCLNQTGESFSSVLKTDVILRKRCRFLSLFHISLCISCQIHNSGMIFSLAILRHPEVFLWHPYGILHGFSAIRSFSCANSLRIVAILCPRVPPFIILKGGKARKTMPSRLLHERSCHLEFCNFTGRGFSRTLLRTAFLELYCAPLF